MRGADIRARSLKQENQMLRLIPDFFDTGTGLPIRERRPSEARRRGRGPLLFRFFLLVFLCSPPLLAQDTSGTFHNPLLPSGPDPWVMTANGFYYYMNTTGHDLTIRRTRDITDSSTQR